MDKGGWRSILAICIVWTSTTAAEAAPDTIKIGLIGDFSSVYADLGGRGSLEAARMAVEDFGGSVLGFPIEIVYADAQNKPDIAAGIAREWFDERGVDMITDLPTTGVALAVMDIARQRHKVVMVTSAGSTDITGKFCTPYSVHWTFDSYAIANGAALTMGQHGNETWFILQVDTVFGTALAGSLEVALDRTGNKIAGVLKHPTGTQDFSSFLLQAEASKAGVIVFANAGEDTARVIKQAAEFGITRNGRPRIAAPTIELSDLRSVGLEAAQGLAVIKAFYWDIDERSRQWSRRFYERMHVMPTMMQAGTYGAVSHYLKAVAGTGSKDADAVMARMRDLPIDDFMTAGGKLRIDGRVMRDMYMLEVKKPDESHGEWDMLKLVSTVPGDQAFRALAAGHCPLVTGEAGAAK